MVEKTNPSFTSLTGDLKRELGIRVAIHRNPAVLNIPEEIRTIVRASLYSQGIIYSPEDTQLIQTHLQLLQYFTKIIGGVEEDSIFGAQLNDGKNLIYWTSSSENDVRLAIPMANGELKKQGVEVLIPELPAPKLPDWLK